MVLTGPDKLKQQSHYLVQYFANSVNIVSTVVYIGLARR